MDSTILDRVIFFSKDDGSAGYNLQKAEKLLQQYDSNEEMCINDMMEIQHVRMYFDHNMFLSDWDQRTISNFNNIIIEITEKIKKHFLKLDNASFQNHISNLDVFYREAFWKLINDLEIYKCVDQSVFPNVLKKKPHHIRNILCFSKIVSYFD